jgi:hypothetical protein
MPRQRPGQCSAHLFLCSTSTWWHTTSITSGRVLPPGPRLGCTRPTTETMQPDLTRSISWMAASL